MIPVLQGVALAHEPLWLRADQHRDDTAVLFEGLEISWQSLRDNVGRAATLLRNLGVGPDSRVGLLARNSPLFIELTLAAGLLGASVTPVNWRLTSSEILFIAQDSDLEVLFVEPEFAELVPAPGEVTTLRQVLSADYQAFRSLAYRFPAELAAHPGVREDTTLVILYSSGTTGRPKGVMIPHRSMVWRARQTEAELVETRAETGAETRLSVLVPMPMFHIGGLAATLFSIAMGRRVNLLREARLSRMVEAIDQGDNQTFLAPTVLQSILDEGGPMQETIGSLRELRYGASPMPLALLRRVLAAWPQVRISQAYGLTESAGGVVELTDELHREGAAAEVLSAGKPLSGVELKIVDPDSLEELPTGVAGEIWVRCPYLATGYYGNPEATAATFTPDGWLRTGDIGDIDEAGHLFIRDRLKDMIISGGENIYTSEVELAISQVPGVSGVAVVGVPDERWGERPVAYVEVEPGAVVEVETLREQCIRRLAAFKRPDRYTIVEALPRNATGKILKHELRNATQPGPARVATEGGF